MKNLGKVQEFDISVSIDVFYDGAGNEYNAIARKNHERYEELKDVLEEQTDDFPIIDAEIVRPAGMGGAQATITTSFEETEGLKWATEYWAEVIIEISINDWWVFTGEVVKITEDEESVLTFEAMDARRYLHQHTVRLDTPEDGTPSTAILWDILVEDGPFDSDEVHIDLPDPERIDASFGDPREPLRDVVKYLTEVEAAFTYIDGRNHIHIKRVPPMKEIAAQHIIELDAGSTSEDDVRVIAEAPSVGDRLDFYDNTHHDSTRAEASNEGSDSDNGRTYHIQDNNVKSVKQASNKATSNQFSMDFVGESGEVILAGDERISPWDRMYVQNLPEHTEFAEGEYSVQSVTQELSISDGFKTTVKLSEDVPSIFDKIHDTEGVAQERSSQAESEIANNVYPDEMDEDQKEALGAAGTPGSP